MTDNKILKPSKNGFSLFRWSCGAWFGIALILFGIINLLIGIVAPVVSTSFICIVGGLLCMFFGWLYTI